MNNTLPALACIGGGIFSILAAAQNWNFFFESRKSRLFVGLFGREGARVVYALLGVGLLLGGLYLGFVAGDLRART